MKILVVGQGGREHALVHAFAQSPQVDKIYVAPGNDGMKSKAQCLELDWTSREDLVRFCKAEKIDFVFIGPEDPLVQGLSDQLRNNNILVVGPSQAAAQLEGSKIYSKFFMQKHRIPTAPFEVVKTKGETLLAAQKFTPPYVLKADGLAAGKGVVICATLNELENAASDFFEKNIFGPASSQAIIEQFMPGWELSFLILTNGSNYQCLPLAQDHKRLLNENKGPNTGGMGTIAPLPIDAALKSKILADIVEPSLRGLKEDQLFYRGVLFIGVMITKEGPQVLEYNCRFGDPETQVILPLIKNDLAEVFLKLAKGEVVPLELTQHAAACVVLAAPGYPSHPQKGVPIQGDPLSENVNSYFLHAGLFQDQIWKTNGGRVLNAVGLGQTLEEALAAAYGLAKKVHWEGMQMRTDIGQNLTKISSED